MKYVGRKCVIEGLRRVSSPVCADTRLAGHSPSARWIGRVHPVTSEGVMTGIQARKKTWAANCCAKFGKMAEHRARILEYVANRKLPVALPPKVKVEIKARRSC